MELNTKRAGVLTIVPVNQQALLDIIVDMGGIEAAASPETAITNEKAIPASNRMITYCAGWGVADTPPASAIETLEALGKPTNLENIARANWLRYIALDDNECSELVRRVMAATFGVEVDGD